MLGRRHVHRIVSRRASCTPSMSRLAPLEEEEARFLPDEQIIVSSHRRAPSYCWLVFCSGCCAGTVLTAILFLFSPWRLCSLSPPIASPAPLSPPPTSPLTPPPSSPAHAVDDECRTGGRALTECAFAQLDSWCLRRSAALCAEGTSEDDAAALARMRCYLRAVYPTGRWNSVGDAAVAATFCSRQLFYVTTGACNASVPMAAAHASSGSEVVSVGPWPLRGPEGLPKWPAGCTAPGDACASTSLDAPPPPPTCCLARVLSGGEDCGVVDASGSTLESIGAGGSERGGWIEVTRKAFNGCKGAGAAMCQAGLSSLHGWFDVLDDGASGWWYVAAPGSGIWYQTGRILRSHSKLDMLVVLLTKWIQSNLQSHAAVVNPSELVAELTRVCGPRCANASLSSGPASGLRELRDMLWALQRKATTCAALGWDASVCSGKQINGQMHLIDTVDDRVDGLLVGLGRVLRYDSLLTTEHIPVITDLRAPDTPASRTWLRTMHKFGFSYKWPPVGFKKRWQVGELAADESAAFVQSKGTLTLRDPLRVEGDGERRPCAFDLKQPTISLACLDHVSWMARGLPGEESRERGVVGT